MHAHADSPSSIFYTQPHCHHEPVAEEPSPLDAKGACARGDGGTFQFTGSRVCARCSDAAWFATGKRMDTRLTLPRLVTQTSVSSGPECPLFWVFDIAAADCDEAFCESRPFRRESRRLCRTQVMLTRHTTAHGFVKPPLDSCI